MIVEVDSAARTLRAGNVTTPCAIGKGGVRPVADKREGDGATPFGTWPVRAVLLRPDRVAAPKTGLPWRWIRPDDGWSDDPVEHEYNRPVRYPHPHSAERLWREDGLYDVIVVLGHNDTPPAAGMGSAIFLHCWNEAKPTEGCVAIPKEVLLALVERMRPGDAVRIA